MTDHPTAGTRRGRDAWLAAMVALVVTALVAGGLTVKVLTDRNRSQLAQVQLQVKAEHDAAAAAAARAKRDAAAAKARAAAAAAAAKARKQAADLAQAKRDAAQAKEDAAAARAAADRPNVVVVPPAPQYDPPTTPVAGTYPLTSDAYPGPIHAYSQPNDTSTEVQTIAASEYVSVYCSVQGEDLNGEGSAWDWNGTGWVWDHLVDGPTPPTC